MIRRRRGEEEGGEGGGRHKEREPSERGDRSAFSSWTIRE
jgi:hypothetical protein